MFEVPFGKLRDLLEQLGFTMKVVSGSHVLFQYPDNNWMFMLRPYTVNDRVEQAGLQVLRFQLDSWGLMDEAEFDEQMRQFSLAGWHRGGRSQPRSAPGCPPSYPGTSVPRTAG